MNEYELDHLDVEVVPGDCVKFWDYTSGNGYVHGLVVNISLDPDVCEFRAMILYNGFVQAVPMTTDWIQGVLNK